MTPPDLGRVLVRWVAVWASLFVLWLVFVATLDPWDAVAGVIAASVATIALVLVSRHDVIRLAPSGRWLLQAWRLPGRMVVDFGLISTALFGHVFLAKPVRGSFRAVKIPMGGNDGRSIARRVVLTAANSFAPNAYVIGFDRPRGEMLVHQLVPGGSKTIKPRRS